MSQKWGQSCFVVARKSSLANALDYILERPPAIRRKIAAINISLGFEGLKESRETCDAIRKC